EGRRHRHGAILAPAPKASTVTVRCRAVCRPRRPPAATPADLPRTRRPDTERAACAARRVAGGGTRRSALHRLLVAALDLVPVDHVVERGDVVGTAVLVLQVVGVL